MYSTVKYSKHWATIPVPWFFAVTEPDVMASPCNMAIQVLIVSVPSGPQHTHTSLHCVAGPMRRLSCTRRGLKHCMACFICQFADRSLLICEQRVDEVVMLQCAPRQMRVRHRRRSCFLPNSHPAPLCTHVVEGGGLARDGSSAFARVADKCLRCRAGDGVPILPGIVHQQGAKLGAQV